MNIPAIITACVILILLTTLIISKIETHKILLSAFSFFFITGILPIKKAFAGLSNEGVLTVVVLFVVVAGLQETRAVEILAKNLLGKYLSLRNTLFRIMFPLGLISAFMNNTPLVAMFIPTLRDWAEKKQISSSKLLIPLSYASILGGMITTIGTSTNLVVVGLMKNAGLEEPGLFSIAPVGIAGLLLGGMYVIIFGPILLPDRKKPINLKDDFINFTVEMQVEMNGPMHGKTIEDAGLRHLPGLFLMEIYRKGHILTAVDPSEVLESGDRLIFVGVVESVVDLQKIRGLALPDEQSFKLESKGKERILVEAVVSARCPILGKTIRDSKFRNHYNAVIIAVARSGERIKKKIGDIELYQGDVLLMEVHPYFLEEQRYSSDFYLISKRDEISRIPSHKTWWALGFLVGMVALATTGFLSMIQAALLVAILMILTGCVSANVALKSIDWNLLLTIVSAFGIGIAFEETGVAKIFSESMLSIAGNDPIFSLFIIYGITMFLTEIITNNAAAILVFPIAMETAKNTHSNPIPFAFCVMLAASASFATPIGYQTNLMVYGPGGYKFSDFLKFGIPLNILLWGLTVFMAVYVWGLTI